MLLSYIIRSLFIIVDLWICRCAIY